MRFWLIIANTDSSVVNLATSIYCVVGDFVIGGNTVGSTILFSGRHYQSSPPILKSCRKLDISVHPDPHPTGFEESNRIVGNKRFSVFWKKMAVGIEKRT
jgi:hypothetical protein